MFLILSMVEDVKGFIGGIQDVNVENRSKGLYEAEHHLFMWALKILILAIVTGSRL